jgi:hypothetical protein
MGIYSLDDSSISGAQIIFAWLMRRLLLCGGRTLPTSVRFDSDAIIHRVPEPLFAARMPLSRLDAHVAGQELDLFQLAASLVTQTRAYAAEILCGHSHILKVTRDQKLHLVQMKMCRAVRDPTGKGVFTNLWRVDNLLPGQYWSIGERVPIAFIGCVCAFATTQEQSNASVT